MKKVLKPVLFFILIFALSAAASCAGKISDEKAREMFESAVLNPEQAFPGAETFYMKTGKRFENLQNRDAAAAANTEEDEYWREGNKIRFSNYINKPPVSIEMHLVFDGKTLTMLSNIAPQKQTELNAQEAQRLLSASSAADLPRASGAAARYSFKGSQKSGDFDCYVIGLYLAGENAGTDGKKEVLKNLFYIDKKTNVVVKAESYDLDNAAYEVKKIGRIDNRFFPADAEVSVKDISKITLSYGVKVNEAIDPAVFDASKLSAEVEERRAQQNQFMRELAEKFSAQTATLMENALNAASSSGAAGYQSVLTNELPKDLAEYEKHQKDDKAVMQK